MEVNFKVPASKRPKWLEDSVRELISTVAMFDTLEEVRSQYKKCLENYSFTRGGGGADYPCSLIKVEVDDSEKIMNIYSVMGVKVICQIKV